MTDISGPETSVSLPPSCFVVSSRVLHQVGLVGLSPRDPHDPLLTGHQHRLNPPRLALTPRDRSPLPSG